MTTVALFGKRAAAVAMGALAIGLTAVEPAQAQPACAPHDQLADKLQSQFSEKPVGLGLSGRQRLVELYRSDDGRTWSLVTTNAEGVSCIVDAGVAWNEKEERPKGFGVTY
jgi:hypothetical protein